eukprot:TRINITY_DN14895_c0_g1_i1.p1 TRINITY_DN14895_c0_g1~~TRINITY_DN14895_c0_g1_i1.p1  ORF type:complete len:152 (+),score=17.30 TRINITY_DN14895_c0_g1_i1:97-552(+)
MALKYNAQNPNTTWINNTGFIAFYIFIFLAVHFVLLSFPFFSNEIVWTLTNILHSVVTFGFLHWLKGAPFSTMDQGEAEQQTQWEQLNRTNEMNNYKRFFIAAPVIVFFLTMFYTGNTAQYFTLNLIFLGLALIPKIPALYGVRLFGINRY